jgi:hypothetical protein
MRGSPDQDLIRSGRSPRVSKGFGKSVTGSTEKAALLNPQSAIRNPQFLVDPSGEYLSKRK